jgi:hypothetical protein
MALTLTCVCGARSELEDTLAGQTITCPECQQPLQAPTLQPTGGTRRTNLLALLSAGVALAGAFTPLIGQVAAVVLGSMALVRINRRPDREAGAGLALFGIVCGLVFGALMVFALFAGELFGVAGWWREKTLADQVDSSGPLEFSDRIKGFTITRPSRKWGIAVNKDLEDPYIKALTSRSSDLLLVNLNRPILVDVQAETANFRSLEEWENSLLEEWRFEEGIDLGFGGKGGGGGRGMRRPMAQRESPFMPKLDESTLRRRNLEVANGQGRELEMDLMVANQRWHMMIRLYRTQGKLFVVRAYAHRQKTFKDVRSEIDSLLDSFKITR